MYHFCSNPVTLSRIKNFKSGFFHGTSNILWCECIPDTLLWCLREPIWLITPPSSPTTWRAQVQGQQVGGGSRTSEGSLGTLRGPRMGPDPMGTGVMVVLKDRYASRVYSLILLELKGVIIKTNYTFSSTNNFKLWIFPHICNELNKGTFQYIKINVLIINHVKNVFIIYYNLFQIAKRIQILP